MSEEYRDQREYGPRCWEYGEVWETVIAIPIGTGRYVRSLYVERKSVHDYVAETPLADLKLSATGVCDLLLEPSDDEW